jgi:hypothetical protein
MEKGVNSWLMVESSEGNGAGFSLAIAVAVQLLI